MLHFVMSLSNILYFCAMQYKQLFNRTKNILSTPHTEWAKIKADETSSTTVINDFVLPMAGLCALSAFLGMLFQSLGFEKALVSVIISLGKTFGGVYFTFFVLQETAKYFGLKRNKLAFMQMAGYSFALIFVVDIIANLIPELFFLPFLELYVFYIIWEASDVIVKIDEKERVKYVISVSLLILISSFIIGQLLSEMLKVSSEIVA